MMTEDCEDYEWGRRMARRKIYKEFWYDNWMKQAPQHWDAEFEKPEEFHKWIQKRTTARWKYMMFTVSPKNCSVELFVKQTEKCVTKKWIKNYLYCYEWTKEGMIHNHIRVELDEKKKKIYRCKGEIANTFKKCGDVNINVRYSNDENAFKKYIMGEKMDNFRQMYVPKERNEEDRELRKKYGLKDVYASYLIA